MKSNRCNLIGGPFGSVAQRSKCSGNCGRTIYRHHPEQRASSRVNCVYRRSRGHFSTRQPNAVDGGRHRASSSPPLSMSHQECQLVAPRWSLTCDPTCHRTACSRFLFAWSEEERVKVHNESTWIGNCSNGFVAAAAAASRSCCSRHVFVCVVLHVRLFGRDPAAHQRHQRTTVRP